PTARIRTTARISRIRGLLSSRGPENRSCQCQPGAGSEVEAEGAAAVGADEGRGVGGGAAALEPVADGAGAGGRQELEGVRAHRPARADGAEPRGPQPGRGTARAL